MPFRWVQTRSHEFRKSQFAMLLVRVHSEPWQFIIFADGNADSRGIDVPVSSQMKCYSERVPHVPLTPGPRCHEVLLPDLPFGE
jgi:hypothetical protein